MNNLLEIVGNLSNLYDDYKTKIEGFDKNYGDLENILTKVGNYVNSQKVVFIGRNGSNKSNLISELKKISMADINSIRDEDNSYKSKISSNYKCSNHSKPEPCLKLCLPKSLNALLDKITIFDPPYYNYSDELDNEIVEKCKDANIFVLVLSAVGSIGDQDKKFLTRIFKNVFVKKLIFIFTNMENVPKKDFTRTKRQHELNASRIANEILRVKQTNVPIFFVRNNQLEDIEKFLSTFDNLTLHEEKNNCKSVLEILKETIKNEKIRICKENETLCINTIENERITENVTIECELIKQWRNIIDCFEKRVEKKNSFPVSSKSKCIERKESIKKNCESIVMKIRENENVNESDKNALIHNIRSMTDKFDSLFDGLLHFNKKFDNDQFRPLPEYFNYLIDIIVKEPFGFVSDFLVGFESELFLILSYFKRNKWHIRFKHTAQTRQKRKSVLRDIILNITRSNMRNENKTNISSNESKNVAELICNQNDFVDNSDEILETMLENIELMIQFDWNEIFDKASK